jgi:predicted glycosyltransferase
MRILVDITHPAHAHFFRYAIRNWRSAGHEVCITSRQKDMTGQLLAEFGYEHIEIGKARHGMAGLALDLAERAWGLGKVIRQFEPDVATAIAGTFIVYGCLPYRVPTVVFYDTEFARVANAITYPLATAVVTPRAYRDSIGRKHVRYAGFQETAYTHPDVFTPDPSVLALEGLEPGEPFSSVRMVSWRASHDMGRHGIQNLRDVIDTLKPYGRVVLTSETGLPADLHGLVLKGPRRNMLHLQALARLYFGESATMAAECAMLGTPAIFVAPFTFGNIDELQGRYAMAYYFLDPERDLARALEQARALLEDPQTPALWQARRRKMLAELVNVTDFVTELVPGYARSKG